MIYDKNIIELEKILKNFSNKHRIAILKYLKEKKEASVGSITDNLECPYTDVSKHLIYLKKSGILRSQYDGPFVMYKISENLSDYFNKIISIF